MKLQVYSIFDNAFCAYMQPSYYPTKLVAIREFSDQVNKSEKLKEHAADYSLFKLGEFDDESGQFVNDLEKVANALEFLETHQA